MGMDESQLSVLVYSLHRFLKNIFITQIQTIEILFANFYFLKLNYLMTVSGIYLME